MLNRLYGAPSHPFSTPLASNSQTPAQSPASTSLPPPRRPSSRQLRSQIVNFPPDVWDKIASYGLSHADLTRMSAVDKGMKSALEPRLKSKESADQASRFNSLTEMDSVLKEIKTLRFDLKSEPLGQVMRRLHALPLRDRPAGLVRLRAALADPAVAIEYRPSEPPGLDQILSYLDASFAVWRGGESVEITASIFNITNHDDIQSLEIDSAKSTNPGSAGYRIITGGNVQIIARDLGITSPDAIQILEYRSVNSNNPETAGYAISDGGNVQRVAQQFGITSPEAIRELELCSVRSLNPRTAGHAIRGGGNVQTVAQQFGITPPEGIRALENATTFPTSSTLPFMPSQRQLPPQ